MRSELARKSVESILYMSIAMALGTAISAVGKIILAAQLDAGVFGNFTMAMALTGFLMLLVNTMGDRLIVVAKQDREKVVSTVFTTEICIWLILSSVWLVMSPRFWPSFSGGMSWWLATLLLLQGLAFPIGRPRALLERDLYFRSISIVNVISQVVCVLLAVVMAVYVKNELPLLITSFTVLIQSIIFFRIGTVRVRFSIDPAIFRDYVRLCLPLMASSILVFSYWNGDRILLDRYVTREQLGNYGWAFSLGVMILRLKDVVGTVVFPVLAELIRSGQSARIRHGLSQLYQAIMFLNGLVVPGLLIVVPSLVRLAGDSWVNATTCVQLAILIFAMRTLNSFLEPVFITHARSHLLLYIALFNASFILLGGWLLLHFYPRIETMAATILLSCVITFLFCVKTISSLCSVNLMRAIAPGIAASVISGGIMSIVIHLFGEQHIIVLTAIAIGILVYLVLMSRQVRKLIAVIVEHTAERTPT